jgi:hypothetical protein
VCYRWLVCSLEGHDTHATPIAAIATGSINRHGGLETGGSNYAAFAVRKASRLGGGVGEILP